MSTKSTIAAQASSEPSTPSEMNHITSLHNTSNKITSLRPTLQKTGSTSTDSATILARLTYQYFYSPKHAQFEAKVKSHGTLGEDDHLGYTAWNVIIAIQAFAECLFEDEIIKHSLLALQSYWSPEKHSFCSWKYYPGNADIYFDDNAHAANALISVTQATGDPKYLRQAKSILISLLIPASRVCDGALPWHTNDYNTRHACSVGPAAIAALRIYLLEEDHALLAFAEKALQWLTSHLQDPQDSLIWDSLKFENGWSTVNLWKWSYNTGFAMHGFALLYEATGSKEYLDTAVKIAKAAMNPDGGLFDQTLKEVPTDDQSASDPSEGQSDAALVNANAKSSSSIRSLKDQRMYADGSFFLHHLANGYLALSKHALTSRLHAEISRMADFGHEFMYDPADGLYFRGCKPWKISEELTQKFNDKYGSKKELEKDMEERDEQGNLCKTLIGNAGWARIFKMAEGLRREGWVVGSLPGVG